MAEDIYLEPNEVWEFFQKNKVRLKEEQVLIAENTDTEHEVYLTDFNSHPRIKVFKGDMELRHDTMIDEDDCTHTTMWVYSHYLHQVTLDSSKYIKDNNESDDEDMSTSDVDDKMYEREDALILAAQDFLEVVLECYSSRGESIEDTYGQGICEEILESVCKTLASDYLISVRRPMWVENKDNTETYVEYPYLDLSWIDDENNLEDVD